MACSAWGVENFNHHHLTGLSPRNLPQIDDHVVLNALVFGDDKGHTAFMNKPAHQPTDRMLKNFFNNSLGPAATVGAREPCRDTIAVHGLKHFARRDKNIIAALIGL